MDGNGRRDGTVSFCTRKGHIIRPESTSELLGIPNPSYWTSPSTWLCYQSKPMLYFSKILRSQMSEVSVLLQVSREKAH